MDTEIEIGVEAADGGAVKYKRRARSRFRAGLATVKDPLDGFGLYSVTLLLVR